MKIYMKYNESSLEFEGFYIEGIHDKIPKSSINIDEELWRQLQQINSNFKLVENFTKQEIYTKKNMDLFETIKIDIPPSQPSRFDIIEELNSQLMLDSVNKELNIDLLEKQNAQNMLDSANKDIEIKTLQNDLANLVLEVAKGGLV